MMDPIPAGKTEAEFAATHAALFTQMVQGHGQMALMFLGRLENPQTGQREEAEPLGAKLFIDQLDMLAAKTRGNLCAAETLLLEETLTSLHQAFVQVVNELPGGAAAVSAL